MDSASLPSCPHQISLGRCLLTTQDSAEYGFWGTQERDVDKAESHALHAEVILCSFLSFVWRETLAPGHLYPHENVAMAMWKTEALKGCQKAEQSPLGL